MDPKVPRANLKRIREEKMIEASYKQGYSCCAPGPSGRYCNKRWPCMKLPVFPLGRSHYCIKHVVQLAKGKI